MRRVRHLGRTAALILAACSKPAPPEPDLAQYLYELSGKDERTRAGEVALWQLDRGEWDRTVVEPYRAHYDDYVARFDATTFVKQLEHSHAIQTRAHFAGDPKMTWSQALTRWALPTLARARIAELAGQPPTPIEAVFVYVDGHWRAIVGIGAIIRDAVARMNPACAQALDRVPPAGACIEAAWDVADAALRNQGERFAHACGLVANLCGKPGP